jgi:hypothetical protein
MKNKTLKNKTIKNKTLKSKKIIADTRLLKIGFPLYASKKYEGDKLLEYKRDAENKTGDHCLLDNSSWFGDLDVAKSYKTPDTHIYKFEMKRDTKLLKINRENEKFLENIFKNTKKQLTPTINLTSEQLKKIKFEHPYLNMTDNEKAYYEFCFAFGYISVEEQYEFLNLVKYLIENKFIKMETREGSSIISKVNIKINYYRVNSIFPKKQKLNRISIYLFDKYAIMNLCRIIRNNYAISGVYQKNDTSFWFPDFIIYKMNTQEYILFNPHKNLNYTKEIE